MIYERGSGVTLETGWLWLSTSYLDNLVLNFLILSQLVFCTLKKKKRNLARLTLLYCGGIMKLADVLLSLTILYCYLAVDLGEGIWQG